MTERFHDLVYSCRVHLGLFFLRLSLAVKPPDVGIRTECRPERDEGRWTCPDLAPHYPAGFGPGPLARDEPAEPVMSFE